MTVLIGQHEGLPNITGTVSFQNGNESPNITGATGAFKPINPVNYAISGNQQWGYSRYSGVGISSVDGETKADGIFKNDVYGKSDHLQTNNITVRYWKRIA